MILDPPTESRCSISQLWKTSSPIFWNSFFIVWWAIWMTSSWHWPLGIGACVWAASAWAQWDLPARFTSLLSNAPGEDGIRQYAHCPLPHIVTERMGSIRRVPKPLEFEWHEFPGMTSWQPYSLEKTEVWGHFRNMIPYNIPAMRPEQSWPGILINFCLLIPPPQHHSPHLAPCLWTHMETTYCKLDLAAAHDVVQERMHLVDLQRRRGNRFSNSMISFLTQWKLNLWG